MTLLLFDGLDNVPLMPKPAMFLTGNGSNSQVGRDGSTNGAAGISADIATAVLACTLPTSAATCIMGCGFKAGSVSGRIRFHSGGTATNQCSLWMNATTRRLELRLGESTVLASSPIGVTITLNTWVSIQIKVVLHATTGSFIVRLNDAEVINYSGQTATTGGAVTSLSWATAVSGGADRLHVDDVWVCDAVDATATQGRANNDFLGDLRVVTLVPDGAGDSTDLAPSTGSNWSTLDENPPTATDYVSALGSDTGFRDLYTMSNLPADAGTVLGLDSRAYATKTDIGAAAFDQLIKESGVVTSLGRVYPSLGLTSTTTPLITQRPSDGTPLTVTDVNGMQMGLEVA